MSFRLIFFRKFQHYTTIFFTLIKREKKNRSEIFMATQSPILVRREEENTFNWSSGQVEFLQKFQILPL